MEKINFTQQGGFPLQELTLDKMQASYMEILRALIGHFDLQDVGSFVIYGCEVIPSGISKGLMYIDGDLCSFNGITNGTGVTKIGKIETVIDAPFESGDNLPTYYSYTASEITSGLELSSFERVPKIAELVNVLISWNDIQNIPQNIVIDSNYQTLVNEFQELKLIIAPLKTGFAPIFWGKPASEIPQGWAEDTDWRGRIPVGMNINVSGGNYVDPEFSPLTTNGEPGRLNGTKKKTLQPAELPPINVGLPYTINYPGGSDTFVLGPGQNGTKQVALGGTSQEFSILNPTRTVLFIKWNGI
jgi:hypothetical protein